MRGGTHKHTHPHGEVGRHLTRRGERGEALGVAVDVLFVSDDVVVEGLHNRGPEENQRRLLVFYHVMLHVSGSAGTGITRALHVQTQIA